MPVKFSGLARRRRLAAPGSAPVLLNPVRPNAGLQALYHRRLAALVDAMHNSLLYWVQAHFRANPAPALAQDANPSRNLDQAMRRLSRRWQKNFNDAAPEIAGRFATTAQERADGALEAILKKRNFAVEFTMTEPARAALSAVVVENVGLIKSIAQQHLSEVEGLVMRSAAVGRDVGSLAKELERRYAITKRRAALIARDQTNKATAVVTRVRQAGLGITEAVWVHSAGGKTPRPQHVAFNGKRYDIEKGAFLEGRWTWPGHEINCRCVSKSIIKGLDDA